MKRIFWVYIDVSMHSWAEGKSIDAPQDYCAINYQSDKKIDKYMQCMDYYKEMWEWFARCKPVVVQMCRQAVGYC